MEPTITTREQMFAFNRGYESNRARIRYGVRNCIRAACLSERGEGPTVITMETGIHWRGQVAAIEVGSRMLAGARGGMSPELFAEWLARWDVADSVRNAGWIA